MTATAAASSPPNNPTSSFSADGAAAAGVAAAGGGHNSQETATTIILPPPSSSNPLPQVPTAIRLDNLTILRQALLHEQQFLVFGDDSLRTLLLRQVLSDPHNTTTNRTTNKNTNKNWEDWEHFEYGNLPILGTACLILPTSTSSTTTADNTSNNAAKKKKSKSSNKDSNKSGGGGILSLPVHANTISFFLRPTALQQTEMAMACIANHKIERTHFQIFYLPETTDLIRTLWSTHPLLLNPNRKQPPNITIKALQLDWFPIDADLLSLEQPDALREMTQVENTPSFLISTCARALLKLQDVVGSRFPRIQSYGIISEQIVSKFLDLQIEEYLRMESTAHAASNASGGVSSSATTNNTTTTASDNVAAVVVLDRRLDWVTTMLTPLTYEGLLDDIFQQFDLGYLQVNEDILQPPSSTTTNDDGDNTKPSGSDNNESSTKKDVALPLNAISDTLFAEIRNQHIEQFGTYLSQTAKQLEQTKKDFSNTGREKNLSELQKFVKNLPNFKLISRHLSNHVHLAECLKHESEQYNFRDRWQHERSMLEGDLCLDDLDDYVSDGDYPVDRFLRLLILQSLCKNGIGSSRYDHLKTAVVQTYGYQYLQVLSNLEKAGLLKRKEAFLGMDKPSAFSKLKDTLALIHDNVDTVNPDDISYVSSGYAPLTVRMIQNAVSGWKQYGRDCWKDLPGRFLDIENHYPPEDLQAALQRPVNKTGSTYGSLAPASSIATTTTTTGSGNNEKKKKVLMIFYVGGVTYMELASWRFLSKSTNFPYHIIVCTTKVVNGSTIVESLS